MVESVTAELRGALGSEPPAKRSDPIFLQSLANRLLTPHVDFDAMSAWVLGRYWNQATVAQQERFKDVFKRLLVKTYAAAIQNIETATIEYLPERDTGKPDTAVVRTTVAPSESPKVAIDYYLHLRAGKWDVYDLRIEGISLIANYRSSYASQVQAQGIDQLIQSMEEKLSTSQPDTPATQ